MRLGLAADLHGDLHGFEAALAIFQTHGVGQILCAGDIVDRGPDADRIVLLLKQLGALCVKGNHEYSVLGQQARRRASDRRDRLAGLGRVIGDDTAAFIEALPDTCSLTCEGARLLIAHGVPWSDVLGVFPNSRPALFHRLVDHLGGQADILILGHTHQPMDARVGALRVINPGSVYGITIRDSHTCAVLDLPGGALTVFSLRDRQPIEVAVTVIAPPGA
ncbi:MAG: metallophosphoesterase family protein [Anaerolineae bacterium]